MLGANETPDPENGVLTELTHRQLRFVGALRAGLIGKAAAVDAGYSPRTAAQAACRLAKSERIRAALAAPESHDEFIACANTDQQRAARIRMCWLDALCERAKSGDVRALLAYITEWRRSRRRRRHKHPKDSHD
ncbi:hypothetical protein [Lysobacter enzymogenes]|uniref:hypothetical protein n=1 Tax=Lysobacter enzymogenes TaxID=69 RepID=UPI0013041EA9|nr:hypothetical protein [Lysobacter enzymogenes]UZW60276.1 hypothetical protein BV903_023880 [Lysobacter enzymogenes]